MKQFTRTEAQAVIDELRAEAANLPEMTLEEINDEINAAIAENNFNKNEDYKDYTEWRQEAYKNMTVSEILERAEAYANLHSYKGAPSTIV